MLKCGIVVSTFGTPAFVGLQLESARRFAADRPILIHDDCSADAELSRLAHQYGAELQSTPHRLGHCRGDVAAYSAGIRWGETYGLDYIIKISRRFVLIRPWLPQFNEIAANKPATIGAADSAFGWYLRTEFLGMRISDWKGQLSAITSYASGHVEDFLGNLSKLFGHFAAFPFLGRTRYEDNGNFLWYNFADEPRYSEQAKRWGIFQPLQHFDVRPNLQ